ncbi:MAG: transcription initiation protein [Alphaproteobacteria bacterium]|nr:transcription initiation protein [Alphaproteobacteria bacterium]
MPKFVTIGYASREDYDRTPEELRNAAHKHDARLSGEGAVMGIAGAPVQVRNHNATKIDIRSGPFMSSPLPLAGFAIIEAADISEAVSMVTQAPCAVANGVVEVWPLELPG